MHERSPSFPDGRLPLVTYPDQQEIRTAPIISALCRGPPEDLALSWLALQLNLSGNIGRYAHQFQDILLRPG